MALSELRAVAMTAPLSALAERYERLWEKVIPEPMSGCWLWLGYRNEDGYAVAHIRIPGERKRIYRVHRLFYELTYGPIPAGREPDHRCRVRSCVNPAHLEIVTTKENVLRGEGITARNARKTHCSYGHALKNENLLIVSRRDQRTYRICRICRNERDRIRMKAKYRRDHPLALLRDLRGRLGVK